MKMGANRGRKLCRFIRGHRELCFFGLIFIAVLLTNLFFCQIAFVHGPSMEPTFSDWDCVLVIKICGELKTGDIVVTNSQNAFGEVLIKRIVALPGQRVTLDGKALLIDGLPLEEPYAVKRGNYESLRLEVPEDACFLMGDNRDYSRDSRDIGCIPQEQIIGTVVFRIFTAPEK